MTGYYSASRNDPFLGNRNLARTVRDHQLLSAVLFYICFAFILSFYYSAFHVIDYKMISQLKKAVIEFIS